MSEKRLRKTMEGIMDKQEVLTYEEYVKDVQLPALKKWGKEGG